MELRKGLSAVEAFAMAHGLSFAEYGGDCCKCKSSPGQLVVELNFYPALYVIVLVMLNCLSSCADCSSPSVQLGR